MHNLHIIARCRVLVVGRLVFEFVVVSAVRLCRWGMLLFVRVARRVPDHSFVDIFHLAVATLTLGVAVAVEVLGFLLHDGIGGA